MHRERNKSQALRVELHVAGYIQKTTTHDVTPHGSVRRYKFGTI